MLGSLVLNGNLSNVLSLDNGSEVYNNASDMIRCM